MTGTPLPISEGRKQKKSLRRKAGTKPEDITQVKGIDEDRVTRADKSRKQGECQGKMSDCSFPAGFENLTEDMES